MTEPLASFYRRYDEACNAHRCSELGAFVAEDVEVNGERQGLDGYIAGRSSASPWTTCAARAAALSDRRRRS